MLPPAHTRLGPDQHMQPSTPVGEVSLCLLGAVQQGQERKEEPLLEAKRAEQHPGDCSHTGNSPTGSCMLAEAKAEARAGQQAWVGAWCGFPWAGLSPLRSTAWIAVDHTALVSSVTYAPCFPLPLPSWLPGPSGQVAVEQLCFLCIFYQWVTLAIKQ